MKSLTLKLFIVLASLFLVQNSAMAQENKNKPNNKLKLHAISVGYGVASSSSSPTVGIVRSNVIDLSTIVNKHIISIYTNFGSNKFSLKRPDDLQKGFVEASFTYGRKWILREKLCLEGHLGLGVFMYGMELPPGRFDFPFPFPYFHAALGMPIRAKLLYYPLKRFGIGLNPNTNINLSRRDGHSAIYKLKIGYSASFLIQYHFN